MAVANNGFIYCSKRRGAPGSTNGSILLAQYAPAAADESIIEVKTYGERSFNRNTCVFRGTMHLLIQ